MARPTALIQSSLSCGAGRWQRSTSLERGTAAQSVAVAAEVGAGVLEVPRRASARVRVVCAHPQLYLVAVCDEVHVLVSGGDLKGVRPVDGVFCPLDAQAAVDLDHAAWLAGLRA